MKKFRKTLFIAAIIFIAIVICSAAACVKQTEKEDTNGTVVANVPIKKGMIYSMEEAYNAGFLTADDIRSIAYYHNGGKEWKCVCGKCTDDNEWTKCYEGFAATDYTPQEKIPSEFDEETVDKIKTAYIEMITDAILQSQPNIKPDVIKINPNEISVFDYCGTYNGFVAVIVSFGDSLQVVGTPSVAGSTFFYPNSNRIILWAGDASPD